MFTMRSSRAARVISAIAVGGLVAGMMIAVAAPSFAVHNTGMFELDGNIAHDAGSTPPYDWASLFDASGNPTVTADPINGPLLASTFVHDSAVPDQSYFTSNKDIQPIASGAQHWACDPIAGRCPTS